MEDMRKEAVHTRNIEIAIEMIRDGKISFELISKYTDVSLEKIEELAKTLMD